jgi:hypothetical protein
LTTTINAQIGNEISTMSSYASGLTTAAQAILFFQTTAGF